MRAMKWLLFFLACGCSSTRSMPDASVMEDAAVEDVSQPIDAGADVDKAAPCASKFGTALTDAFGRIDGTILAVVPPTNMKCALPNSTHLVLQVSMNGAAYRMVINVHGAGADPRVFLAEKDAPLAAGAWLEGWHPNVMLDYVGTLGVHSDAFVPMDDNTIVAQVTSELELGARVSVFATSDNGYKDSAHLVHRNKANADGAIVIHPDQNPHWLLFRFPDQTF